MHFVFFNLFNIVHWFVFLMMRLNSTLLLIFYNNAADYYVNIFENLAFQKLLHEIEQVEAWMSIREPLLREKNYGDSISNVEELLRRHADFEKTVSAHEERIDGLRRIDKVQ